MLIGRNLEVALFTIAVIMLVKFALRHVGGGQYSAAADSI
jgi:hypothetical protein